MADYATARSRLSSLEARASILPQGGPTTDQVQQSGERTSVSLRGASGTDFDKAYIDARIAAEGDLLALLDGKLVPQVQNADLRDHLQDLRASVARHLKSAREVQAALA